MKKFNHRDFDIETELITTRDGSIRGNLVNWDTVRRFQEEVFWKVLIFIYHGVKNLIFGVTWNS